MGMRKLFSRSRGWVVLAGIAALSATLAIARSSLASDHQDTPEVELSPRMDVNDVYAFRGASADRIVLAMTTSSPITPAQSAGAAFDWRPAADYARRGGLYRVARHHYADQDGAYSFDRLDAEVVQHIPILRETWVVSLHGRLETTLDDNDQVPYFMLPSLGSGSTLRGYDAWRFRDRHAVLLSGEWRWIPSRMFLDMALFYDTGMVAPRLDAIALGSFVNNVGVGMRFHAPARTPLRVEFAKGSEGLQIVFAASAAF